MPDRHSIPAYPAATAAAQTASHGSPAAASRTTPSPSGVMVTPRDRTRTTVPAKPASPITTLLPPARTRSGASTARTAATSSSPVWAITSRSAVPPSLNVEKAARSGTSGSTGMGPALLRSCTGFTIGWRRTVAGIGAPAAEGMAMSKPRGSKDFWLAGLRAEATAFATAVDQEGALELPVPSCPGWTVADLVRHLGDVYRFVHAHVSRGVTTRPDPLPEEEIPSDMSLVEWWHAQYTALFDRLDGLDPELTAWNWAPQPKKAVFWHRRMAHETAVHRWDAQIATGLAEPIEAKLAADGLTEVLDTWLAAGRRKSSELRSGVIALQATDLDEVWYVRLRGEGIALLDTDTLFDDDDRHERAT